MSGCGVPVRRRLLRVEGGAIETSRSETTRRGGHADSRASVASERAPAATVPFARSSLPHAVGAGALTCALASRLSVNGIGASARRLPQPQLGNEAAEFTGDDPLAAPGTFDDERRAGAAHHAAPQRRGNLCPRPLDDGLRKHDHGVSIWDRDRRLGANHCFQAIYPHHRSRVERSLKRTSLVVGDEGRRVRKGDEPDLVRLAETLDDVHGREISRCRRSCCFR
jgi:hypothetical protein